MKKLKIHFVGIKGVGMTPLAIIAKEAGFTVSGSDMGAEFITDAALHNAKILPMVGFSGEHVAKADLVITTGAHGGQDNIEVKTAKENGIKVISQGEAVGLFMKGELLGKKLTGISVTGTHGKTTTSAMTATILKGAGYDPSYIIGTGNVGSLGAPGHFGKSNFFVAEADEYATDPKYDKRAKFLWQQPAIALITNIEFDHPDVYASLDEVKKAFSTFAGQLSDKSVIIACGDDRSVKEVLRDTTKRSITYGFHADNNYVLERVHISGSQTFFWLTGNGIKLGEFSIKVPGEHNALNAAAAVIACIELGLPVEKIRKGISEFRGSKRRLEFIGDLATGAKVYDDYAHHPTEIRTTLSAVRKQYPDKKIVCIFQPHTYSRTQELFREFQKVFSDVNTVLIADIYASQREQNEPRNPAITSASLAEAMKQYHKDVLHLGSLADVVKYVNEKKYRNDTILITMGAGDVYKVHNDLKFAA